MNDRNVIRKRDSSRFALGRFFNAVVMGVALTQMLMYLKYEP